MTKELKKEIELFYFSEKIMRDLYESGDEVRIVIENGIYSLNVLKEKQQIKQIKMPEILYKDIFKVLYNIYTTEANTYFSEKREQKGVIYFLVNEDSSSSFSLDLDLEVYNPEKKRNENIKKYKVETKLEIEKNKFSFIIKEEKIY